MEQALPGLTGVWLHAQILRCHAPLPHPVDLARVTTKGWHAVLALRADWRMLRGGKRVRAVRVLRAPAEPYRVVQLRQELPAVPAGRRVERDAPEPRLAVPGGVGHQELLGVHAVAQREARELRVDAHVQAARGAQADGPACIWPSGTERRRGEPLQWTVPGPNT